MKIVFYLDLKLNCLICDCLITYLITKIAKYNFAQSMYIMQLRTDDH